MNTPNKLTVMRMLITPVFLAFYLIKDIPHSALWALIIFLIASVTDAVDGRLARKYNQVTVFGKLADPVADKMLTTAALLAFMNDGLCSIWTVFIILPREFAVTAARLIASSQGVIIPANIWGKVKTVSQMVFTVAVLAMLVFKDFGIMPENVNIALISNILLGITAVLAVISGIIYLIKAKDKIDITM